MSKFTDPLDNVRIASPCPAKWEEMHGDARRRFCAECKLNVYNLSAMTKAEAENLLINSEGRLCVRFYRRADGTVLTQNCPVGWGRIKQRVSKITAAAFSMLIGFFGGMFTINQASFDTNNLMEAAVKPIETKREALNEIPESEVRLIPVVGAIPVSAENYSKNRRKAQNSTRTNGRVEHIRRLEDEPVEVWIK